MMVIAKEEGREGGFLRDAPTKMEDGTFGPQDLQSFRLLEAAAACVHTSTPTITRAAAAAASVTAACVAAVATFAVATSVGAPLATSMATIRSSGQAAAAPG